MSIYGRFLARELCSLKDHFEHTMMQHGNRWVVQHLTEWFSKQMASGQVGGVPGFVTRMQRLQVKSCCSVIE